MNYIYYNEFGKEVKKYLSPIAKGSSGIKIYIFSDFDNSSETEYEVSASFKKADGFVAGDIFLPLSVDTKVNPYNQQPMYYRELIIASDVTDIVGGLELSIRYITINVIVIDPNTTPETTYNEEIIKVTGMVTFNIYNAVNFITPPQNTQLINLKNYVDDRDGNFVVKEAGKGLSEENYTLLEKNKLASVEQNAQKNVQSDFAQSDSVQDSYILNKPILKPVATSGSYNDLENKPVIPSIAGLEDSANKIDTFDGVVDNIKYPGALLVKNYLEMLELLKANAIPLLSLSPESPILPEVNDCFYQEDVKTIFKWNGTSWLPLVDPEDYLYQYNGKQYKYNASAGLVTVGKALSMGDYYTQEQIDAILSATYRPGGSKTGAELVSSLLIKANLGLVYDISTDFTSTIDFVEGAGELHTAGTNVAVVEISAGVYKFDIMSGFVDLSGYVEKDGTKVLSDNNFTTLLKDKLTGIEDNAEANVQSDFNQTDNTKDDFIKNKPTIPDISTKVDKIDGKGLSTNDFTTTLKNKLDGAEVTSNKIDTWSVTPDNIKYPTEKLVKDNLDAINAGLESIGSLSPLRLAGYFTGGTVTDDFNNLIKPFENLTEALPDFYINNIKGAMFVCNATSDFVFNTVYTWADGIKTTPITFTWAAPYDETGVGTINFKVGDIISILNFAYDTVDNEMFVLIKVEKSSGVKADKVIPAATGNIPKLNAAGNLEDSGFKLEKSVPANAVFTDTPVPQASAATRGGIKAAIKQATDTVEVKIDTTSEKLYVPTYPTIPDNKSYSKTIAVADWTTNEYAVTITNLTTSDTVLLSGADEIFTTNGLSATITANTLTFEVTTTPTESIVVNFTVIKTTGGSV